MAKLLKSKGPRPEICKTIFQVRYKPDLGFYDRLMSAAQRLVEYPDWETTRLKVTLRDYDKHCSLVIEHKAFGYEQDSSDTYIEKTRIQRALEELPSALQIDTFYRFGYRRKYLIAVEMPFESLVSVLNIKLFSQNNKLREIIPPTTDLMYVTEAVEELHRYHITIGPVRKPEIPQLITYNIENHLRPETREEAGRKIFMNYPDVAVFADIDLYQMNEEGFQIAATAPFVEAAQKRIHELITNLMNYLFSEEVEA